MVRKKDNFWQHAEQLNGKFQCNYCRNVFSGGITRLKFHLSGLKGNDVEVCTHVPDDVQAQAFVLVDKSGSKRSKTDASYTSASESFNASVGFGGSSGSGMHQTSMPDMLKKMDKSGVDKLLAKFFILNNISFNVVQSRSFIELVGALGEFGPSYKVPSFSTLRTKLIPEAKKDVDEYVEKVKKSWEKTGCTIMSDTWSDMKQRCFINFIAHSPVGAVFLQSVEISKHRKTALLLKDLSSKVIDVVGSQNVVQFITDNASNFESAGDMLVGKYPTMYKTRCSAHGIQLLFKDIYKDVDWLRSAADDGKSIQLYMYKHQIVTSLMREATNGRELKKACATRFATNFLVLQSILDVENELRIFVASPQWRGLEYSRSQEGKRVTEIIQDHDFWAKAKDAIDVLEPFVRILRLVDGDGSTAGYLYQAMDMARESIEFKCSLNEEKYGRIKVLSKKRRDENIIHPIHAAAAFLNPTYMLSSTFKETWEMKQGVNYIFENLVADNEKDDFLEQIQLYRIAYGPLFSTPARAMLNKYHPRIWWDYCGDVLPVLQKYAIRILSQPCSSSSCERNWSAFEAALTKRRNKLTPQMLGTLVYVRMNSMMIEKFQKNEIADMKIIDLSSLKDWPDYGEEVEPIPSDSSDAESASTTTSTSSAGLAAGFVLVSDVCLTVDDDDDNGEFHDYDDDDDLL